MHVALFGGTGFIGSRIARELIISGHTPILLVRPGSERKRRLIDGAVVVSGAIESDEAVRETLSTAKAAVYAIGIIREFPRRGITYDNLHYQGVVRTADHAKSLGVKRFLLMSAHGAAATSTAYQTTKFRAEEYLRASSLVWTIFRPSIVFGDPQGGMEFCTVLKEAVIETPFPAPLFFKGVNIRRAGTFRFSPVHVDDVAKAVVRSLAFPSAINTVYELGGPVIVDWKTLIATIAEASGRKKAALPAPAGAVSLAAALFDRFPWFPITRDQITMLLEGNVCDGSQAFADFGIDPVPFDASFIGYLKHT